MDAILQIVRDYGAAFAALLSIIALIVVILINRRVSKTLIQILRLKDESRVEKSKVIVEAFNIINKLEQTDVLDYKDLADELDRVYNRLYSVVADARLVQAYDRVVTTFIVGNKASLVEFEILARKELGLNPVNNKSKQNYLLMIGDEQKRIEARRVLEEQKRLEEMELANQKEQEKLRRQQEKELKKQEKEELKRKKALEKKQAKEAVEEVAPQEEMTQEVETAPESMEEVPVEKPVEESLEAVEEPVEEEKPKRKTKKQAE